MVIVDSISKLMLASVGHSAVSINLTSFRFGVLATEKVGEGLISLCYITVCSHFGNPEIKCVNLLPMYQTESYAHYQKVSFITLDSHSGNTW